MKAGDTLIKVENIHKTFKVGQQDIEILKGIDLSIKMSDFAIILGPSGCGKSTLLHSILGLERPTEGKVIIEGNDMYSMTDDDIVRYRKGKVGIVFQQPIWIKSLNVIENVCVPSRLIGLTLEEAEAKAMEKLKIVGLEQWIHHHPSELSSGQQQRVSLARALTLDPLMIVADEPTGNLDTVSGDELMDYLQRLCKERSMTVIMVTHDLEYLRYATALFHIIDGKLVETYDNEGAKKMAASAKTKKGDRTKVNVRDGNFLKETDYATNKKHS
ncbi:MAG TPA: ABC transporter ATP-binding protein [Candidatus Woesebacteria bacterium]|nr:ABC transporter ATP-binding protein [Candidatus Woesebacteria bacterium]HPJ17295.1 ABC transporter ATP-binding protein [Candidatus Woesebacteria bacterium]